MQTDTKTPTADPASSTYAAGDLPPSGVPPEPKANPNAEAWRLAVDQIGELKDYAAYFVSAKIDALIVTVRKIGILAALGVVGLLVLSTIVVMMAVMLCLGIAGAFEALTGRRWVGDLLTFGSFTLVIGVGARHVDPPRPSRRDVDDRPRRLDQPREM